MMRGIALCVALLAVLAVRAMAQTDTPTQTPTATFTAVPTQTATATCGGTIVTFTMGQCCDDRAGTTNCDGTTCTLDTTCSGGKVCSGFVGDDGSVTSTSVLWPPRSIVTINTTGTEWDLKQSKGSTQYTVGQGLVAFDTSSLGVSANIVETKLRLAFAFTSGPLGGNPDPLTFTGQWWDWGPTIDASDYTLLPDSGNAFSIPITNFPPGKHLYFLPLTNGNTMVNKNGETRLRLSITGKPAGQNAFLVLSRDTVDINTANVKPALEVCLGPPGTPTASTPTPTSSPTPTPLWFVQIGGVTADVGQAVTTDSSSNVFVGGFFTGTIDLGTGQISSNGSDAFVAKYNPTGGIQWVAHAGNAGSNTIYGLATDSSGDVFLTGRFQNSMTWTGCPTINSALASSYDIFLVKLNPSGGCVWAKNFGGGGDDTGFGVAVDSGNNVIFTGSFAGHVSFGGTSFFSSNTASSSATIVAKYNNAGTHQWSTAFSQPQSNNGPDEGHSVTTDPSGNVYVGGVFQGTEYFDQVTPITSNGSSQDAYVAKFAGTTGVLQWVRTAGNIGADAVNGVCADASGNVSITGAFSGSIDWGTGVLTTPGAPSGVFVASFTSANLPRWSTKFVSTTGVNVGYGIACDQHTGEVVTVGSFQANTDFGGGPILSHGGSDIFIAKYTSGGGFVISIGYGGPQDDISYGDALNGGSNMLLTGFFRGLVNFGGPAGAVQSRGSTDAFLLKLDPPLDAPAAVALTAGQCCQCSTSGTSCFTTLGGLCDGVVVNNGLCIGNACVTKTPMPTSTSRPSHTPMPTNTPHLTGTPTSTPTITRTRTITPTPTVTPLPLLIQVRRVQLVPF